MNRRQRNHERERKPINKRLRSLGLGSVKTQPRDAPFDLLVGAIRVALKVSYQHRTIHRVTSRGRPYAYHYGVWRFNFHRHGRMKQYADLVICVAKGYGQDGRDEYFVIPWSEISGKTFALHRGAGDYIGRYNKWQGKNLSVFRRAVAILPPQPLPTPQAA